jgi:hypothetical protein
MDWLWMIVLAVRTFSAAPGDEWAVRLAELDTARAAAFAEADPSALADVYAPRSSGRRSDAATIKAYARRGGRVVGANLRVLTCRVIRASDRTAQLDIVDQLAPTKVIWANGTTTSLPRDRPTRRTITLQRTTEGWRITHTQTHTRARAHPNEK